MLNLEELVFKVNTQELEEAVTKVNALGTAVSNLNKPIEKNAIASAKLGKAQQQEAEAAAKAAEATAKATKAQMALSSAQEKVGVTGKQTTSILQRQQDILNFQAEGFSRGQASILSYAKAAGTAADEMQLLMKVVKDQRTLMGTDPFDKSIGGLQALENELAVVTKAYELHGRQLGLTQKQTTELARDYIRLRQQFIITKKDLSGLDAEYEKLVTAEVKVATAQNKLVQEMKAQDKAAKDTAKANEYLAKEMDRVNRMLNNTEDITSTTNNKLIKFEQALKQSGMTAAQQATALDKYKKSLLEIQQAGGNRQVDYLSRALGPQITDIFVGLTTGQSPLMVLLQQGGQLRDQFALAGVAGADMGKMLTTAAASMISSVKDISLAVGGLFVNAITGASKSIVGFADGILKQSSSLEYLRYQVALAAGSMSGFATAISTVSTFAMGAFSVMIGVVAAGLIALPFALAAVIKEQNALSIALATTGGNLGLTTQEAITYASSMNSAGISTSKAMEVIAEMSKTGVLGAKSIDMITESAVNLEKYAGVAIADTVKQFAELAKSPLEALSKLSAETGKVSPEVIKLAGELERQGRKSEAAGLAMREYAAINAGAVKQITDDYGIWMTALKALEGAFASFWDRVKGVVRGDAPTIDLSKQLKQAEEILESQKKAGTVARFLNPDGQKIWQAEVDRLKETIRLQRMSQDADEQRVRSAKAQVEVQKILNANLSSEEKTTAAIKNIETQMLAAGYSRLEIEKEIAKYKANNAKKPPVDKADNEYAKYIQRSLESVRDLAIETDLVRKGEENITKAAKIRADLMDDPLWAAHSEQYKINILAALEILDAQEKSNKEVEKEKKLREEMQKENFKYMEELEVIYETVTKSQEEQAKLLKDSSKDLDLQYSLIGKSADEQKVITDEYAKQGKLKKASLDLEKELAEIRRLKRSGVYSESEITNLRLKAEANYAEKVRQINSETALKAAQDYQKAFEEIQNTITDIIATALFEGGKAGQKKLKDILKSAFRKFVIDVFINPIVKAGMNLVLDAVGLGGGSSSALSMGSNALSISGLGSSITSGIVSGFAEASAGAAFVGPSATLAPGATGFGAQIGSTLSAMGPAGWAALAVGALLASGFGTTPGEQHQGGMYSTRGSDLNMETARSITGGGGWDDGAWARDLTERSSESVTNAVGKIVDGALGDVNSLIKNFGLGEFTIDAGMAANVNGEGTDKNVFGYFNLYDEAGNLVKEYINRELGTDLAAAVQKFGGDIQEAVASVVLEGTNFKREGETNAQTLARLSTSLTAVNQVADLLGMKSLDLSLAGGDAASSLVDLFGSIENLQSASQSFYDSFASDTTKLADAQSLLDTTFADLGYSIPDSREGFYQLATSLDLSTEAGRTAYAALLGVGDAFLYVEDAATRAAEAENQRQEKAYQEQQRAAEQARQDAERAAQEAEKARTDLINKSYSALEKAINKQKTALQAQFDLAKQIYEITIQAVRELRGQVSGTNQMLIQEARDLIQNVISTGALPDPAKLSEAITKVREELQTTRYRSKVEQDKATLLLSLELEKIADLAEPQMTTAELQLKALTDLLEQQKALVDAALGNVEATLSVEQALANLAAALAAPAGGSSGGGSTGGWGGVQNSPTQVQNKGFSQGVTKDIAGVFNAGSVSEANGVYTYASAISDASGLSAGPGVVDTLTSNKAWSTTAYASKNPDVVSYYNANKALITELGQASNLEDYLNYHFITYGIAEGRQFANGGAFTNGIVSKPTNFNMGQMGEAGPEAIMPLTNIGGKLGVQSASNPELVNAIDRMNNNIEMLRSEIRADVTHNSKTSRLLDRVIQDGRSINVTASIDGGAV